MVWCGFFVTVIVVLATIRMGASQALGDRSVVSGGWKNKASGRDATVGGGYSNEAGGLDSVVVGGAWNKANGFGSAINGGRSNLANGACSTVTGGLENKAHGGYSLASGFKADASDKHSAALGFSGEECQSKGEQTVHVCATNGFFVNDNNLVEQIATLETSKIDISEKMTDLEGLVTKQDSEMNDHVTILQKQFTDYMNAHVVSLEQELEDVRADNRILQKQFTEHVNAHVVSLEQELEDVRADNRNMVANVTNQLEAACQSEKAEVATNKFVSLQQGIELVQSELADLKEENTKMEKHVESQAQLILLLQGQLEAQQVALKALMLALAATTNE